MRVFAGVDAGILCINKCDSVGISSPAKTYAQQELEVGRLMASAEAALFSFSGSPTSRRGYDVSPNGARGKMRDSSSPYVSPVVHSPSPTEVCGGLRFLAVSRYIIYC